MKPTPIEQPELVSDSQALQRHEPQPVGLSIEQVFAAVMEKDINPEKVAVMKELLAMSAERQFAVAFVKLQSELPVIVATTIIPNRGKYEKFEDVMRVISEPLKQNGFTVSFSMDINEIRIVETCHLSHIGGHTRSNSFAVRPGKADSDTQSDCKAATTAKRNALCNALNIVIRQDYMTSENDARLDGEYITAEQAKDLRRRVHETGSREEDFLKFAGARTYEEIYTSKYVLLDTSLRKKERT